MTELPIADRFGPKTDNLYWNESVWFSVSRPEEKIHGFVQYYFRPNMHMLNGGPVLWDPSGVYQWNCLYYNWSHLQAMPEGVEKFNMKARNSLAVKILEPAHRYAITYDQPDYKLDLEWESTGPMHELFTSDAGVQKTHSFHIEQPGRMKGRIICHGREIPIDCLSMRDTSFGPREYESLNCGGYFWGLAEGSAFHALAMGEGDEQKVVGGFIWKDNQLASLAGGTRTILARGRHGPSRVRLQATDKQGRTIDAIGEIEDGLVFTGYTDHTVIWSLAKWDWNNQTYWGDNQEFSPTETFRRLARKAATPA